MKRVRSLGWVLVSFFAFRVAAYPQNVPAIAVVSAASNIAPVAPDSLATAYGQNFTNQIQSASMLPLPNTLAGIGLTVMDSTGASQMALLLYASPKQINFVIPAGTAAGMATFQVMSGSTVVAQGSAEVLPTAPGLFAVNSSGLAAAYAVQTIAPQGPETVLPVFQCSGQNNCNPVPLTLGIDTPLFLELFGTGIRGSASVTVTINGQAALVLYSGAESQFPGLDQVNIPIDLNLRNAGLVPVVVTVDGQASNPVFVEVE